MGGFAMEWCCDYPSVSFADSSPDKGSLGALPRQCGSGMLRLKTRGGFFVPSQSKIKDFCQLSHRGSEPSAASGRKSEVSEWQRSKKSRKSVSPKIFSGTATGELWALPRQRKDTVE